MSSSLHFMGDVLPKDVMAAVSAIKTKRNIQFVDWCPTGFKCGIKYVPWIAPQSYGFKLSARSVVMLANNTSIVKV